MLTEEQEKALLEEIDKLRQDKAALISRVASLEQSLYWLRKKVFGRMSEKNLPLDPNQLFLFSKEEMSSMEISRMEDEVRKSDEEITRTIKVKEKPSRKPLDTSSLPVEVVDLYPEGTTDGEGRPHRRSQPRRRCRALPPARAGSEAGPRRASGGR